MGSFVLPLSNVVDVTVSVSPQLPATPTFNQGLIVGSSPVIPSVSGNGVLRCRQYSGLAGMLADGFTAASPEYMAASLYFGQSAVAQYLWVGRQDLTALQTIQPHAANAGTGFAVGDTFNIVQAGATLGVGQVTTIGANGTVTTATVISGKQGTGYQVAQGLTATAITGNGIGLEVDILTIGETALQAVQACRLASVNWWAVVALNAADADHIAIGEWAQSQVPQCMYMYTTGTAAVANNTAGNCMAVLKAGNYSRAWGIFSTTQNGLYPNNIYAAVAVMGLAMGLNTGLANSFFTLKFKTLTGIYAENQATSQLWSNSTQANVEGNNGNVYVNYGNAYNWLEQGTVASGQFFDEILNLDMLASDYQYSILNLLTSTNAVAQTDAGQTKILNTVDQCNARAATRGFIKGGTWTGATVLNLNAGTALPNGYLSQSASYSTMSTANRQARQSMPVYVAIIEAGAVHSVLIGVYVQR